MGSLLEHESIHRLALGALSEAGVRALLSSPEAIARILARTGGSPKPNWRWIDTALPTRNQHLLGLLAGLGEGARRAVYALSVLGRATTFEALERVIGDKLDGDARRALSGLDALDVRWSGSSGTVGFLGDVEQRSLYEALEDEQRHVWHARWLDVLSESGAEAEERARHALKAGELRAAARLAKDAARSLSMRHAPHEAAELLEVVLAQALPEDAHALRTELVALYRAIGDYRRGLVHARCLRDANPEHAGMHRTVGDLLAQSGQLDQALEALREALARAADDVARCEVEALLADVAFRRGDLNHAREWAEHAVQLASGQTLCARSLIAARNTLGKMLLARGERASAAELFAANQDVAAEHAYVDSRARRSRTSVSPTWIAHSRSRQCPTSSARSGWRRPPQTPAVARSRPRRSPCARTSHAVTRPPASITNLRYRSCAGSARLHGRGRSGQPWRALSVAWRGLAGEQHVRALGKTQLGGARLTPTLRAESLLLRGRVALMRGDTAAAHRHGRARTRLTACARRHAHARRGARPVRGRSRRRRRGQRACPAGGAR